MRDHYNFRFFGRGDVSPTHSELCRLVSGPQAQHQVSSPLTILLKKIVFCIGHRNNDLAGCNSIFPCSGVKECGTRRRHNFLFLKSSFIIWRITVLGMFKDSAIILDAIRRSFFFTKSATAALLTSVRVDFGRPPLLPSPTDSLPFRNRENLLKTFDRFRDSFP